MESNQIETRPEIEGVRNVLVVEDDPDLSGVICKIVKRIKDYRFNFSQAESPLPAIEWLKAGLKPEVILSDMMMPNMNGMQFYQWLQKNHPELLKGFRFVTGGSNDPEVNLFLSERARLVLEKPLDRQKIREAVLSILRARQ